MNTEAPHTAAVAPRNLRVGLAVVLVLVGGAATAASFTQRVEHRITGDVHRFPTSQSLTIDVDDASVMLVAATGSQLEVVRDARWSGPDAPRVPTLTNGLLRLRRCPIPWWQQVATYDSCTVNYRVAVPAGQDVTVRSGNGNTTLAGTFGTVKVSASNGTVAAENLSGDSIDLRSDNGDLRLALGSEAVRVVARSSNGDVRITVGTGQYAVTAKTSNGDVNVDPQLVNGQSPRVIDAFSDNGDVTVGRQP